jgi:hypothetical protein
VAVPLGDRARLSDLNDLSDLSGLSGLSRAEWVPSPTLPSLSVSGLR